MLGPQFRLPLDVVTETIGWVGNRGSGKSNAARVAAEEMIRAGDQVVAVDPVDAWYGLAYGATKSEVGLPVYVFGGPHGHLPLESTAGALLADVVVEQGISAVFSLRHLPKGQQRRFMADFAARLYLRKAEPEYRTALHVFIEEAHTFAPQGQISTKDPHTSECLGAVQDLVLQGRGSGIGVSLITQRVAALSRSVLELAEVLCAFRTTGPNARKALKDWFDAQADDAAKLRVFMDSVASLGQGIAYVWSPGYLALFETFKFRKVDTFDSSATPARGERVRSPGKAAALDLSALGEQIDATRERAEANDPKRLHAEIARLTKELEARPDVEPEIVVEHVQVPVVPAELREAVGEFMESVRLGVLEYAEKLKTRIEAYPLELSGPVDTHRREAQPVVDARGRSASPARSSAARGTPVPDPTRVDTLVVRLGKRERSILSVLVTHGPKTQRELATFTGYSAKASTIGAGLTQLRKWGLVESDGDGRTRATAAGVRAAPSSDLPTGEALVDYWRGKLGKREWAILDQLLDVYPESMTGDEIAAATNYKPPSESSTIGAGMTTLRRFGLVSGWRISNEFATAIGRA